MDDDADDVSRHNAFGHNLFQRLIDKNWISRCVRCCRREDKQPSGRDDGRTERMIAGIYEMNAHRIWPLLALIDNYTGRGTTFERTIFMAFLMVISDCVGWCQLANLAGSSPQPRITV